MNDRRERPHGPRRRGEPGEKPKNFRVAISKLVVYMKEYKTLVLIALILSIISSVLQIIGPDKLKELTNEISSGLVINANNLELLGNDIRNDLSNNIILDENELSKLTIEEKEEYDNFLNEINRNPDSSLDLFVNISDNTKLLILSDSVIDGILISSNDKLELINKMSKIDNNDTSKVYKELDGLSENINKLLKPIINISNVKKIALILVIMHITSAIFGYFENYLMVIVSNKFAYSLRSKISKKLNKLPLKFFDKNTYGDILSRVTNDVDTLNIALHNSLGTLVSAVCLLFGSLFMMFKTNYIMALTSILASLFGFMFIAFVTSRSQKYFIKRQKALGDLNGHIEEIYSNQTVVKVYNGTRKSLEEFESFNNEVYNANKMSQFLSGIMGPMMGFIGNLGYVAVCVVGSVLVVKGSITFGVIVAFIMYVRLFSSPLTQIAQSITNLQSAAASFERVYEIIEEKEMEDESHINIKLDRKKAKGNIEFEHVRFGYDEDKIIIKDFNASVKPGQKVAIVGPTGAGKTTMVNLLMKFYNINSGDIKIDGISIKDLRRQNIHDLFIMVLQDTWLFNGTLRDNIKFNKGSVSDEEIWKYLKIVGIDHFVKTLPKMLNYRIEDNESISSGEKQLLTIARGMIEDSPFLILDEATSNVDTRTEELVQKAMDKLMEGRTSFIIAHRLSTIKNADLILVMKDGNIIETGNHEELLKKNGFYAELYNSQFEN